MKTPKISVIMSVYNGEKYLAKAIESILNQTFRDFEFIIINDGSTDNSLNIIKKYAKLDKRVVLMNNKKNIGLTISLNKCLKIAKGEYIARMDADDISLPERFQIQYDFLEKNKNIFLVGTGAIKIDENGEKTTYFNPITSPKEVKKILQRKDCIYHPSIIFRNEDNLSYREKFTYSQDYDFYLCLLSKGKKLVSISDRLINYRCDPNAISQAKRGKQILFAEKAKEFYHQKLKYSKDEYDNFDPNEILNINIEESTNKIVLEAEMKASFKLNDFKRTRKFCERYFTNYGYFNLFLVYYVATFLGRKIINSLRKVVFH